MHEIRRCRVLVTIAVSLQHHEAEIGRGPAPRYPLAPNVETAVVVRLVAHGVVDQLRAAVAYDQLGRMPVFLPLDLLEPVHVTSNGKGDSIQGPRHRPGCGLHSPIEGDVIRAIAGDPKQGPVGDINILVKFFGGFAHQCELLREVREIRLNVLRPLAGVIKAAPRVRNRPAKARRVVAAPVSCLPSQRLNDAVVQDDELLGQERDLIGVRHSFAVMPADHTVRVRAWIQEQEPAEAPSRTRLMVASDYHPWSRLEKRPCRNEEIGRPASPCVSPKSIRVDRFATLVLCTWALPVQHVADMNHQVWVGPGSCLEDRSHPPIV
mmetsp:Transcript_48062/g.126853  ORF Transcript_48062/g.126853 Transcript_48062/m.126853 type:complete len:322 (+) Transcript_48062:290-1255(+)